MSSKGKTFREKYKHSPIRTKAVSKFKRANKYSISKDVRKYMYQVMATIGLELEKRFSEFIIFNDEKFRLFGREKSRKSTSNKIKSNIKDYDTKLAHAIESSSGSIPKEVRPIYDFYAFKLVCPEIENSRCVLNDVVLDILDDIQKRFPEYSHEILEFQKDIDISLPIAVDYIDSKFSNIYPKFKNKILVALNEQKNVNNTQKFLETTSSDVSSLTYSEYYSKLIECYQILIKLSYEESTEEFEMLAELAKQIRNSLSDLFEKGESNLQIPPYLHEEYSKKLEDLLQHINHKKTNKLDLALGDLMLYDVLNTSSALRRLGVSYSKDPTRTKKKRNQNGYIANFYSLDMPHGLTSEIQLQSTYRYEYGEHGPAAHDKMENGIKKRKLYKRPKEKSKYHKWAKKQFKSLPRYFRYMGNGHVQVYNTLQNFRRYYDCKDTDKVQAYISYIAQHDINLLYGDYFTFSLDDSSPISNKHHRTDSSSR